jgi:hypothetical protein
MMNRRRFVTSCVRRNEFESAQAGNLLCYDQDLGNDDSSEYTYAVSAGGRSRYVKASILVKPGLIAARLRFRGAQLAER